MDSKWRAEIADPAKPKPAGAVRLLCMSDTHGLHGSIPADQLYECDLLLFAGDFTLVGDPKDVNSFKEWLSHLSCQKVVIAGNLDLTFDTAKLDHFTERITGYCHPDVPIDSIKPAFLSNPGNMRYAEHECVEVAGVKIFASPYTPEFRDWGFQILPGEGKERWSVIPDDVDVVLTHGPPRGVCDKTVTGFSAGCPDLKDALERTKPALCVFGHIHEAHGVDRLGSTLCCNVAMVNVSNHLANKPTLVDLIPK